jgi:hypothetical protein
MKINWNEFTGKTLHVTMRENYGLAFDEESKTPIFEIVFKTGKLSGVYEEGLMLDEIREGVQVKIFIPYASIKCVEIFEI